MLNFTEFSKAVKTLEGKGVNMTIKPCHYGTGKIAVIDDLPGCDFTINPGTYGADEGLLEVYGLPLLDEDEREYDEVAGWLTAEDVVERVTRALSA